MAPRLAASQDAKRPPMGGDEAATSATSTATTHTTPPGNSPAAPSKGCAESEHRRQAHRQLEHGGGSQWTCGQPRSSE